MKERKIYQWLTLAAVTVCLTLALTACTDDDSTDGTEPEEPTIEEVAEEEDWTHPAGSEGAGVTVEGEQQLTPEEQLLMDQQRAICSILTTLTGVEALDTRFDQQRYEPVYGIVLDESQPNVRAVKSATTADAEEQFRALVLATDLLSPTSDGYTISLRDIPLMVDGTRLTLGTLTFHRGDGRRLTGYVDVAIKCVPHLTRIDYLVPEAFPMNDASNSPYKLGDLVWVNEGKYCSGYYVCVQPADNYPGLLVHMCEGEAKGDETVNFDGDNEGCWIPYNNTKGETPSENDVKAFVKFLINEKDKVANLKLFLDGKTSKKPLRTGKKQHVFSGGFATESNYVYKSDDGKGARIFFTARYGDYAWIPTYYYRIPKYMWVSNYCQTMTYVQAHEMEYVNDSWWDDHVNDGSDFGNCVTEKESGYGHGLVISQSMTSDGYTIKWHNGSNDMAMIDEWSGFSQYVDRNTGAQAALTDFDGLLKTTTLAEAGSPAALAAMKFTPKPPTVASGWFLPSAAQWIAMLCKPGLGSLPMPASTVGFPTYLERETATSFEALNEVITGNAWTYYQMKASHRYWSSSAYSSKVGVYVTGADGVGVRLSYWTNTTAFVRPVFAF